MRSEPVVGVKPRAADVERDARRVFDVVCGGGVALIPLDVAYALVAATPEAVRRIYAAKGRDSSKPMGIVGGMPAHEALHVLDERRRSMVHAVVVEHDLPLSVVARYRPDHAYVRRLDAFVLRQCTLDGTLNLLLNAGSLRTRLAQLCWEHGEPMVGTSANLSLTGSRYRVEEVDHGIRGICDLVIDYGESRHHNTAGLSSTIINFDDLRVVRAGVCFERIHAVLWQKFGLRLADRTHKALSDT